MRQISLQRSAPIHNAEVIVSLSWLARDQRSCNQSLHIAQTPLCGADEANRCQHQRGHQGDQGISARTVVEALVFLGDIFNSHDHRNKSKTQSLTKVQSVVLLHHARSAHNAVVPTFGTHRKSW